MQQFQKMLGLFTDFVTEANQEINSKFLALQRDFQKLSGLPARLIVIENNMNQLAAGSTDLRFAKSRCSVRPFANKSDCLTISRQDTTRRKVKHMPEAVRHQDIDQKVDQLDNLLKSYGKVIVAFSGGVDSTFLAEAAKRALGDNALAVTAVSDSYPEREMKAAQDIAKQIGIRYKTINTDELETEGYVSNPTNRCYFCKKPGGCTTTKCMRKCVVPGI